MSDDNAMVEAIFHYQRNIERNQHDEKKILHCINKLLKLPITVSHLKETGIGRTINSLRKNAGDVGDAARAIVTRWKDMVASEGSESDSASPPAEKPSKKHKSSSRQHDRHDGEPISSQKRDKNNKRDEHSTSDTSKSKSDSSKRKRSDDSDTESNQDDKRNGNQSNGCSSKTDSDRSKHKKSKRRSRSKERKDTTKKPSSSHKERSKYEKKSSGGEKAKPQLSENNLSKNGDKHKSSSKSVKFSKGKPKQEQSSDDDGICSTSGASFAEALGMSFVNDKVTVTKKTTSVSSPSTSKKSNTSSSTPTTSKSTSNTSLTNYTNSPIPPPPPVKLKIDPNEINMSSLLPEISTNYQPLGLYSTECRSQNNKPKNMTEEELLSMSISSRNQRTKVYSGNKAAFGTVSSLYQICIRFLQDNLEGIEYTGGIPYTILKPILERANSHQLRILEDYNPYLIEDTDELWRYHAEREFRNKKRGEWESWRDLFIRCTDERADKLRKLTANIKLSQDNCLPVRQTKLAYVDSTIKPPRNVARKQAKFGTDKKPLVTPSSRLSALATAGAAGQVSVPNPGARAAAAAHIVSSKPKKAPLMQKTLALMKNSTRYKR